MLLYALRSRRLYLSESSQEFNSTAGLMLDGQEPPSTMFCIPQDNPDFRLSFAGDPVGMCVCVCVCVCVCAFACVCACVHAHIAYVYLWCECFSLCVFVSVFVYAYVHVYVHTRVVK